MSLFKRMFSAATGVSFRELAQDSAKDASARATDIAVAANRSRRNAHDYDHFRYQQVSALDGHLSNMRGVAEQIMRVQRESVDHAQDIKKVKDAGNGAILQNAARLHDIAQALRARRESTQALVEKALQENDMLRQTFGILAAAEKKMTHLQPAEMKIVVNALQIMQQYRDELERLAGELPHENTHIENTVAEARRAADGDTRKIKFNETGFATGKTIRAPKTARFTRQAKPVTP